MTVSRIEGGLRVMDHTHICWTRVSTNHLESQIDFLPFDVLTKQSIGIHQQKTIGQFSPVINAWSGFSAPSVVAVVISIVGKVSLTRKKFQTVLSVNYGPPQSFCVITNKSIFSSFRIFRCLLCLQIACHTFPEGYANKDQFEMSWSKILGTPDCIL